MPNCRTLRTEYGGWPVKVPGKRRRGCLGASAPVPFLTWQHKGPFGDAGRHGESVILWETNLRCDVFGVRRGEPTGSKEPGAPRSQRT